MKICATVSNEIFLPEAVVDNELSQLFQKELTFANPKLGELLRLGYSIWRVPKKIICYRKLKNGYFLPIGFGPRLRQFLKNRGDELAVTDQRIDLPVTPVKSKITLRTEQAEVMEKLLTPHRCILQASPGFGKTMLGIEVISRRAQKTLIIVHTRALLQQWQKRLRDFCVLGKTDLGVIGEGEWKTGKKITLAMYQTLLRRGTKEIHDQFGLVIVDECHHVPANTFAKIVKSLSAKYCLGLTATPYRKDKMDKLLSFYLGKIIPTEVTTASDAQSLLPQSEIKTTVHFRPTELFIPEFELKEFSELGTILAANLPRQNLIIQDVRVAAAQGAKIIVLSERVALAENLYQLLGKKDPSLKMVLITGKQNKKDREALFTQLKKGTFQILVATGGVVGEGFDWPAAETLFLTFPFSWKGKLTQYVGRIQRAYPGKKAAHVYDYVDNQMSIFRSMQNKRAAAYRALGAIFAL